MLAGLFPGQGSQVVGMGQDFFESSDIARERFNQADKVLGFELSKLCFMGPEEELTLTKHAQPAILVTSLICYELADKPLLAAAGHSLGEYSALVAAGSLNFEDAVQLVHKRGTYMQEAVEPGHGKMVAVIGPSEEEIKACLSEVCEGVAEIANLNSPGQTVVAGDVKGVDIFSEKITAKKVIPLKVSAPFHCSLMQPAAEKLAEDLDAISIETPKFKVYSNVTAKPTTNAEEVRKNLKAQVCASVRWTESMQNLLAENEIKTTVEFGAGGVLSNLLKRIDKSIERVEISNPQTLSAAI